MSAEAIVREVEQSFCLRPGTLVSRDRTSEVCEARRWAVVRLYAETDLTLSAMGQLLGGRDHSTVWAYLSGARLRAVA